jgi:hypothetical protein
MLNVLFHIGRTLGVLIMMTKVTLPTYSKMSDNLMEDNTMKQLMKDLNNLKQKYNLE